MACQETHPPAPYGALPTANHLRWHDLQYYAFVHFNMNTFTDEEWGHGDESPDTFNPTQLDCRQWARICKAAGMQGIIITAKHHDGFCLWPSAYSEHTVAHSTWRDGKGDVLRDLSEACQAYGLKFGVYLSPWDRNHPSYGTDAYNEVFQQTLREVLTGYGEVFEVWFDGANGEGPNGKKQVYDWPAFVQVVRETQPGAVIFSDAGPDIRWVGNERGFAGTTHWCTLDRDEYVPGTPRYRELTAGTRQGTHWVPAEVDVSIRPGWYYHAAQDSLVKTADHLETIYLASVGRGANLLLNLPVDRRGLVYESDSAALMQLKARIDSSFAHNLAYKQPVIADLVRGSAYRAAMLVDGDPATYWAAPDDSLRATLEIALPRGEAVNRIVLQEYIALGQRIESFVVEAWLNGAWQEIAQGTTIGARRIFAIPTVNSSRFRVRILASLATPTLAECALYHAPHAFVPPPDPVMD
ncbi:MAG: hypothetical protein OHK0039_46920 [Bacteroidia bacterium]